MSLSDLVRSTLGGCQCTQKTQPAPSASTFVPTPILADQSGDPAADQPLSDQPLSSLPLDATPTTTHDVARTIDVSHLPPPLPMVKILETLRALGPGETLLVQHTRRPIHLYPKLEALGCTHETTELPSGKIEVRITRPPASPA